MADKYRNYRLLLFSDNNQHMTALKRCFRDKSIKNYFVGCWHTSGKKHCHIVISFPNPRSYEAVTKLFFDESESRFIGRIGYNEASGKRVERDTLERAFIYLPHLNAPEKEQYPLSDLFGSPSMIQKAKSACIEYESKLVTVKQALDAISIWITMHYGRIITPYGFLWWIKDTPYIKYRNDGLVWRLIQQHNDAVYHDLQENQEEAAEKWQETQERDALLRVQSEEFGFDALNP